MPLTPDRLPNKASRRSSETRHAWKFCISRKADVGVLLNAPDTEPKRTTAYFKI
jgi:hypothetical protein